MNDTRYGGPSVLLGKGRTKGLYSTYSYMLEKDFNAIDETAKARLGPIKTEEQWKMLKWANMALTLFSPLGSFYRFAVVEKRVAWPVGISFGVGIFIGSIWLGKYVSALLPMSAYKEWLAVLVVLMGIKTLMEMTPKAMNKRKIYQ